MKVFVIALAFRSASLKTEHITVDFASRHSFRNCGVVGAGATSDHAFQASSPPFSWVRLVPGPIGRASCWERVCQSVLVSVVAVSFTTTEQQSSYTWTLSLDTTFEFKNTQLIIIL